MVSEGAVRKHYEAYARELVPLDREMGLLKLRDRLGSAHWYKVLEK